MPRHDFDLTNLQKVPQKLEDPNELIVHLKNSLRLRQLDANGLWSPLGSFTTADMLIHTWRPEALVEFTGFCGLGEADVSKGDRILFRLSADEGASQLFFDSVSSEWRTPVGDTEWNTEFEIDLGISTFPFQDSITFFVRLESGTGATTPVFEAFFVFWEARYDPTEDLHRSLRRKLLEEVEITADLIVTVPDDEPDDEIDLAPADDDDQVPVWVPAEPIQVFSLDNDPNKREDLFASLDGTTVKLVSPQTGELLVRYRGRLDDVDVATDSDFEREVLPAVVINNLTETRVRDFLLPPEAFEEPLRSKGVARTRTPPSRQDYSFQIQCLAQNGLHDKKLADAVRRTLDTKEFVRSRALDEEFTFTSLEAVNQINRTSDQVFMRIVLLTVNVWEWLPAFEDVPMVLDIISRRRLLPFTVGAVPETESLTP